MKLTLVGLPLGNIEDISLRALRALKSADLVICEDTRVFYKLTSKLLRLNLLDHSYTGKLLVINEYHEKDRLDDLVEVIDQANAAILVSDAGLPTISDPGFHLINKIITQGGQLDVIPGPTAAMSALAISGLSADRVLFLGFLPKKTSKRLRLWQSVKTLETDLTLIIYESPYRVKDTLLEIKEHLGDLPAVIARELTKQHQEILRGSLTELIKKVSLKPPKGEVTLLLRRE